MLSKELLNILACPKCKGDLEYKEEKQVLYCASCKEEYPVTDGIPELLPDKARPVEEKQ